ncbi:MAG TPA: hypothetical protein VMR86_05575 [Myxococcota bacterium]|nr:hypothetical protein [Myxococcota bacterium]
MIRNLSLVCLRAALCGAALAALVGLAPRAARADATQLCRAGSNMILAPFDAVLGPFIAGKDEYYGVTQIDDPDIIKAIGVVPGYILLNGMQLGGSMFREISALMELPMGMVTLFRDGAQPPLFRSQEEAWALYSEDVAGGKCPIRFGTSYNTINDG